MGDLALIIFLVFVASVTTSVAPAVAGLSAPGDGRQGKIAIALVFALVQTVAALIGSLVGSLFMHLVGSVANYVVGGILLFVAVKMVCDSMQVLKGKRLYTAMSKVDILLIAVLSSLNSFMAALPMTFVNPMGRWMLAAFAVLAFVWAFVFVNVKYTPKLLRTTAFVQFSGGVFLAVVAIVYMFGGIV